MKILLFIIFIKFYISNNLIQFPILIKENSKYGLPYAINNTYIKIYTSNNKIVYNIEDLNIENNFNIDLNYDDKNIFTSKYNNDIYFCTPSYCFIYKYSNPADSPTSIERYNEFNLNSIDCISVLYKENSLYVIYANNSKLYVRYLRNSAYTGLIGTISNLKTIVCDNFIPLYPYIKVCAYLNDSAINLGLIYIYENTEKLNYGYSSYINYPQCLELKIRNDYGILSCLTYSLKYLILLYTFDSSKGFGAKFSFILSDCSSDIKDFDIAKFEYNSDIIGCCPTSSSVLCNVIDEEGNFIGEFSFEAESPSFVRLVPISTDSFGITYTSNNNLYLYLLYASYCSDHEDKEIFFTLSVSLDFESLIIRKSKAKYYIFFTQLPSIETYGSLYQNDIQLLNNTKYLMTPTDTYLFQSQTRKGGDLLIKYKIYNEEAISSPECSFTIKINACYDGCELCSSVVTDADNHNCLGCYENYYPSPTNSSNCYKISEKKINWYFDSENEEFGLCDSRCISCTAASDETKTNCEPSSCATNYYPLKNDLTQCNYCESPCNNVDIYPIGYFLNEDTQLEKCYDNCYTCDNRYISDNNMGCVTCIEGSTILVYNEKICVEENLYEEKGFYLNSSDNLLHRCEESCATCNNGLNTETNEQNCLTCKSGYLFIYQTTNCINSTYAQENRYYIKNIDGVDYYKLCYDNCFSCDDDYDEENSNQNCLTCINDYYLISGTKNCNTSLYSEGYNLVDNKWEKCYSLCQTCFGIGDIDDNKCLTCITDYLFFEDTSNCYPTSLNNNGYTIIEDKLYKCFDNCLECDEKGTTLTDQKCKKCKENFYFEYNTNNCYDISYTENGYYLSTDDNKFHICNSNCKTCSNSPNSSSNNCLTCDNEAGLYLIYQVNNCSDISLANNGYILIENIFFKCYRNCLSCSQFNFDDNNQYCLECIENYYFMEGTSNCYDKDSNFPGYSLIDNLWKKCNSLCLKCDIPEYESTDENNGCTKCIENYYLLYNTKNCYNLIYMTEEKNYYLNEEDNMLHKCDISCEHCNKTSKNCTFCNNNDEYYFLRGNNNTCLQRKDLPSETYYFINKENDLLFFDTCYESCATCSKDGNSEMHNCLTCKENYIYHQGFCVEICPDNFYKYQNVCVSDCPEGYFFYDETKECINVCPENTTLNSAGDKCLSNTLYTDKSRYDLIDMIDDSILSYASSQLVIKGDNYSAQVYELGDSDSIAKVAVEQQLSTIELTECADHLKNYYNISEKEDLIMIKIDKNTTDALVNEVEYYIYDYNGKKLDLSLCKGISITVNSPIIDANSIDLDKANDLANQGIDVFNSSDTFFNDLCQPFSSENNSDVTISDRRNDYYQNVSFCDIECEYEGINFETSNAICNCDATTLTKTDEEIEKAKENVFDDIKNFNMGKLKNVFTSQISLTNIMIFKCYMLFFNFKLNLNNFGFWILGAIIFICFILFLLFFKKGTTPIKNLLKLYKANKNELKNAKNKKNNIKKLKSIKNPPKKTNFSKKKDLFNQNESQLLKADKFLSSNNLMVTKNLSKSKKTSSQSLYKVNKNNFNHKKSLVLKDDTNTHDNTLLINNDNKNYIKESVNKNFDIFSNESFLEDEKERKYNIFQRYENPELTTNNYIRKLKVKTSKNKLTDYNIETEAKKEEDNIIHTYFPSTTTLKIDEKKEIKDNLLKTDKTIEKLDIDNPIIFYSTSEYLDLDFNEAVLFDNRSYLEMYWGYVQEGQIIINSFFVECFLELRIIKIHFMFFSIALDFFLNALLYTDDYVSEAYNNNGVLDFISGLPKTIYSFLISSLLSVFLIKLSSSKKTLIELLKSEKNKKNFKERSRKIMQEFRCKLIIYFIFLFFCLLFFWYYVTIFCNVYYNNQKYWVYGSIEGIIIALLTPFLTSVIIAFLRYISIKFKIKWLFNINEFLNLFL